MRDEVYISLQLGFGSHRAQNPRIKDSTLHQNTTRPLGYTVFRYFRTWRQGGGVSKLLKEQGGFLIPVPVLTFLKGLNGELRKVERTDGTTFYEAESLEYVLGSELLGPWSKAVDRSLSSMTLGHL